MGHSLSSHQAASLTFLISRMVAVCFFALCCKGRRGWKGLPAMQASGSIEPVGGQGWSSGDKGGVQAPKQVWTGGPSPEHSRRLYLGCRGFKTPAVLGADSTKMVSALLGAVAPTGKRDYFWKLHILCSSRVLTQCLFICIYIVYIHIYTEYIYIFPVLLWGNWHTALCKFKV